ncbi:Mannan endo-1,6-alpha-mannosidase [Lachnellula willkommii]|uniref:Mannan endo-1,6-alpha-mannosidase n=1 Tax=Lachnellula willkommii TaxID=215461 RepID=A0A559MBX7_9HELO|nr:Mannan endo-1,6-alpha-mannosidase [Lachnellula willkommii]
MWFSSSIAYTAAICTLAGRGADAAITLDLTSDASIKQAAASAAYDMMGYYTGNHTGDNPGNLPAPYYWWEAGAMFGTMVNYWYYTGDTSYLDVTTQGLLSQIGDDNDYMPENQTKTEGNDDQAFWGMAAMTAAETKFQDPPDGTAGWLALAQGVFNTQAARWDSENCNGGLRWQIFTFNNGYDYKNSISNGGFFNLAARLALYTGNSTYADWATKSFDWVTSVGLMGSDFKVHDGTRIGDNCTAKDNNLWTYNSGIYLLGAAAMYNYTNGSTVWQARVQGIVDAGQDFFTDGVMFEPCESGKCNVDQKSFKAYYARWMAATTQIAPFTKDTLMKRISTSATAAVKTCTAGTSGNGCGMSWTTGVNDGSLGVGEQMSALEIIQSNLVGKAAGWVSAVKGTGTSEGNADAGSDQSHDASKVNTKPITTGDRVGAGIFTALVLMGVVGGSATMMISE